MNVRLTLLLAIIAATLTFLAWPSSHGLHHHDLRRAVQPMKIAAAFIICALASQCLAMDRFAALSMLESGDNDQATGASGEVTRYQIRPDVWRVYSRHFGVRCSAFDVRCSFPVAMSIMHDRIHHFIASHHHWPSNLDWYLLWNCPGDINHPSRKELRRAQRFANLCSRAVLPRRPN